MPLYYFNLFDDAVTIDEEGLAFTDDAAALDYAAAEARHMAADTVEQGRLTGSHYIEVLNEARQPVGTVRFDQAVEIKA